jgi:hypothetical protein
VKDISTHRGASALVLSGELTEGVSDLSQAMTAPGGVPALREVNQDRSHPDSPMIEEQPPASYRRLVRSGRQGTSEAWTTVSPQGRGGPGQPPGPAQQVHHAQRQQAKARDRARQEEAAAPGQTETGA